MAVSAPPRRYFGGWAPALRTYDRFGGVVLSASLDGSEIPRSICDEAWLHERLETGRSTLQVVAATDGGPPTVAPIVGVFFDEQNESEVLILGEESRDLLFRVRTRAADVRLRSPILRLSNVVPTTPGKILNMQAGRDGGRFFLRLVTNGDEWRRGVRVSPSWGWSLLLPFDYGFGREVHFLTGLWVGGLLLVVAYWVKGSATGRRAAWRAGAVLVLTTGVGLGLVPWVEQLPPVHWSEWVAALTGLSIGWAPRELRAGGG